MCDPDVASIISDRAHPVPPVLHAGRCGSFPLQEHLLESFATSLASRVGCKTITSCLYGIQFHGVMRGHRQRIRKRLRLTYVLRGIRRTQGSRHLRPRRKPITLRHLCTMYAHIDHMFRQRDATVLKAAVAMAFFGMLRVSEYTCRDAHHYDVDTTLLGCDVYVMRDMALVHLKSSKTDPFRTGVTIRIAATRRSSCPVRWLQAYLGVGMDSQRPLFAFQDGRFLTRRDLVGILQDALHEPHLNTHSLRAGGATTLANMGVSDYVNQILGGWRSDAYKRYVHFSDTSPNYTSGWQHRGQPLTGEAGDAGSGNATFPP